MQSKCYKFSFLFSNIFIFPLTRYYFRECLKHKHKNKQATTLCIKFLYTVFICDKLICKTLNLWWRHQMETFSALLAICAVNSPVTGEFPPQRPVTRSFDVFLDSRLNERLSKQWWGWWYETPSRPLWRHCNDPQYIPRIMSTVISLWYRDLRILTKFLMATSLPFRIIIRLSKCQRHIPEEYRYIIRMKFALIHQQ